MKSFGKLSINPERVMKNEELLNLRGGVMAPAPGTCAAECQMPDGGVITGISKSAALEIYNDCKAYGYVAHWCCDSCGSASWIP